MTKENAAQYLPLVKALAEGKVIQIKMDNTWTDTKNVEFCMSVESYRIKPEPREWWLVIEQKLVLSVCDSSISATECVKHSPKATIIHVREVIE